MTDTLDWQMLIVWVVVLAATAHLAYRAWSLVSARKKSSCGGCGTCPATTNASGDGFVPLDQLGSNLATGADRPTQLIR